MTTTKKKDCGIRLPMSATVATWRNGLYTSLVASLREIITPASELANADEVAAALECGELIGHYVADPHRDTVKVIVPVEGGEVMAEINATKGGHTGTLTNAIVTVLFFTRPDGSEEWAHGINDRQSVAMECGCSNSVRGYYGNGTTTGAQVADYITRYLGGDGAQMFFDESNGGKAVADTDGVNPRVTTYRYADRPDGAWANQGERESVKAKRLMF